MSGTVATDGDQGITPKDDMVSQIIPGEEEQAAI